MKTLEEEKKKYLLAAEYPIECNGSTAIRYGDVFR